MQQVSPIKRSRELSTLSREHHDGLLLCWKIREGLRKGTAPERIGRYVVDVFDNNLSFHFEEEELYLFQLLSSEDSNRKEAEQQHSVLREIIWQIRSNPGADGELLQHFADLLQQHIRFEERTLFNKIEKNANKIALLAVEEILRSHVRRMPEWQDEFWLN